MTWEEKNDRSDFTKESAYPGKRTESIIEGAQKVWTASVTLRQDQEAKAKQVERYIVEASLATRHTVQKSGSEGTLQHQNCKGR
jgi:hypothetical protein